MYRILFNNEIVENYVNKSDLDYLLREYRLIDVRHRVEKIATLSLPIKKTYFDDIREKRKFDEYRECKPFYHARFNKRVELLRLHYYSKSYLLVEVEYIEIIDNFLKNEAILSTSEIYKIRLGDVIYSEIS